MTFLSGLQATFEAVREALLLHKPNIVHFAGHAWFSQEEAFLMLADKQATVASLRPWLTAAQPTLLFLNSHYTSFIPPGTRAEYRRTVSDSEAPPETQANVQAGALGRAAFADMAMRSGVGAFLGSFSGALDDEAARAFGVAVYAALVQGASIAEAVQRGRGEPRAGQYAMFFSLHGEGRLRLVRGS